MLTELRAGTGLLQAVSALLCCRRCQLQLERGAEAPTTKHASLGGHTHWNLFTT